MQFLSTKAFYEAHTGTLPWLIDPFAVEGSTIFLYGRQGIGKSSLAWQLAFALTTGTPWLGHITHRAGRVLYLSLDMPELEFGRLMERAALAGMPPSDSILMPSQPTEAFDILTDGNTFLEAAKQAELLGLIVDTAADAFTPGRLHDINAEVRVVIRRFRQAVPHGLLVLLSHDRKKPAMQSAEQNAYDTDAFLGPTAWEAKTTTSLRLTRTQNGVRLHINKCRLDKPPYTHLDLAVSDHGFFSARPSLLQALYDWQEPVGELKAVFEALARQFGEDPETVRRAYNRAVKRGVCFKWASDIHRTTKNVSDQKSLSQNELSVGQGPSDNHIYKYMVSDP